MSPTDRRLRRRLAPLIIAIFLQGVALWVPIEKLFMTEIGFDAASIGVMAAVYAMAVPIFELPSGVLADRWSRRGVLLIGGIASIISVTIGGLSRNVGTYLVSALFLGIFFAMQSGTFDSVVYDTVLEETGDSDAFEATIGRVRVIESIALVSSALAGAAIAQLAPLPTTYFLTIIPLAGACVALLRFSEPRLHRAEEAKPLRRQLATTYRTLLQPGRLRSVVGLTIAASLLVQGMIEFGPLWLVAFAVPTFLYGPHWAGLTAALGLGGLLGSRPWLVRRWSAAVLAVFAVGAASVLALSSNAIVVVAAQVLLVLVVVAVGIPATRRLHDAVSSTMRASVASGVGTLTWLVFVPFSLLVGFLTDRSGVGDAGWLMVGVAVLAGVLIMVVLPARHPAPAAAVRAPTFPAERFRPSDDADWPGHWAHPPTDWVGLGVQDDQDARAHAVARDAVTTLPSTLRQVIMLRDVRGLQPREVQRSLNISAEQERDLLQRARAVVRQRLEEALGGDSDDR